MQRTAFTLAATLLLLVALSHAQGTAPATPLMVVTREGRRPVPTTMVGGREFIALDELAALTRGTLREDPATGGITLTVQGRTIVISPDQPMAWVDGRVVSVPTSAIRAGRRWMVPLDFIPRALAPVAGQRMEWRRGSRLLLMGDVRLPHVTARIEVAASGTRVAIDLTPAVPVQISQESGTIVLHVDADALDLALPAQGGGLVERVRGGDDPRTIVVALAPGAGVPRVTTTARDGTAGVTVDVPPASTAAEPAAPAVAPAPQAAAAVVPSRTGVRVIAIDPGHGGEDSGVRAADGALEKAITLDIARRLRTAIEARLGLSVVLTRDDDRAIAVDARAATANNSKADLFISLHLNASPSPKASGAEIYRLRVDEAVEAARRDAAADAVTLPTVGGGDRRIAIIRWDLAQARHVEASSVLSGLVRAALAAEGIALAPDAEREGPLRVLQPADMPAVLIELAYLSNPDQAASAASDTFQANVVEALYDAIVRFRDHEGAR